MRLANIKLWKKIALLSAFILGSLWLVNIWIIGHIQTNMETFKESLLNDRERIEAELKKRTKELNAKSQAFLKNAQEEMEEHNVDREEIRQSARKREMKMIEAVHDHFGLKNDKE